MDGIQGSTGTDNNDAHTGVVECPDTRSQVDYVQWVVLFIAFALFACTLDNGLQPEELRGGDLITHQYAQIQARPSNAPGYPLYTMGGWLWFRLARFVSSPWQPDYPNPIPLLSSYSTIWALLALWLLYRILIDLLQRFPLGLPSFGLRIPTPQRLAALLTLFYGITYFFWYYATTTEQYSSAIAQTLALIYLYLRWQDAMADLSDTRLMGGRALHLLLALAFLSGLALAHMLTVAFLVPPLVFVILWQAPGVVRQWRILLMTVVAALLPLLSYLYIYLRGIAHPEWWGSGDWASGADWFWHFVSTSQGREELGWGFEAWCTPWANGFPLLMAAELTWPVLLLGFLGFHLLGKRLGVLLWGTTLIYLLFSWAYRCGNWFQVILPLYPLLIIGLGSLIQRTFSFVAARRYGARWRFGLALGYLGVEICLLVAIGVRLVAVWPMVDSRNRVEDRALDQAAWLLSRPLPDGQALFASLDDTLALQYLTAIWGIEPTAQVASAHQAAQLLASGSTVFSTWEMAPTLRAELPPALGDVYQNAIDPNWIRFGLLAKREPVRNSGLGDNLLWEWPAPQSDWQMPQLVEQAVMPGVTLHGFQVMQRALSPLAAYRPSIAAGQGIDLLLLWSVADGNWPEDIAISVRLTVKGAMIDGLQIDRPAPAMGLNQPPTPLLPDPYFFAMPTEQRMMIDGARLILYRSTTDGFTNVAEVPISWQN